MTFEQSLQRLRDIVENYQPGEQAEACRVQRADLRELLHHFDRLNVEVRQIPARQTGAVQ